MNKEAIQEADTVKSKFINFKIKEKKKRKIGKCCIGMKEICSKLQEEGIKILLT